jgi:predicted RNA-binding protein YlqC (UPF0109 family)
MKVKPDQIGLVIGGGGKTINGIKDVPRASTTSLSRMTARSLSPAKAAARQKAKAR